LCDEQAPDMALAFSKKKKLATIKNEIIKNLIHSKKFFNKIIFHKFRGNKSRQVD